MDRKERNKSEKGQVEEPQVVYDKKEIKFFDSFEELNEYEYQEYAKMSPIERLRTVSKMRYACWPEEKTENLFGLYITVKE